MADDLHQVLADLGEVRGELRGMRSLMQDFATERQAITGLAGAVQSNQKAIVELGASAKAAHRRLDDMQMHPPIQDQVVDLTRTMAEDRGSRKVWRIVAGAIWTVFSGVLIALTIYVTTTPAPR